MNIIGAGGHAKVIIDILNSCGVPVQGIWDDNETVRYLLDYQVLGKIGDMKELADEVIIGIGNNLVRKKIAENLSGIEFGNAFHSTSYLSSGTTTGKGIAMMANSSVNIGTVIGHHCIINTNCSVDHDCVLGNFVHVSPNAALSGQVIVGDGSHIGVGASVIQGIKIGKWATIGAGSVIIRDVPDYAVVVGNPARIIKYNDKF